MLVKPRKKMKTVFEELKTIHSVLRKFGLTCIDCNDLNEIVESKSKIWLAISITVFLLITIVCLPFRFITGYWKDPWDLSAYTEVIVTFTSSLYTGLLFFYTYKNDTNLQTQYFLNYNKLDNTLNIQKKLYATKKISINKLFFILLFVQNFELVVNPLLYCLSYSHQEVLPFFNDHISQYLHFINMIYILVNLLVFEIRFRIFYDKLCDDLSLGDAEKQISYDKNVSDLVWKFQKSYHLLYKQNFIINKLHGWQMFLEYFNINFFIIRTIFDIIKNGLMEPQALARIAAFAITLSLKLGVFTYIIVIAEDTTKTRKLLLLHLEEILLNKPNRVDDYKEIMSFLRAVQRKPLNVCAVVIPLDYKTLTRTFSITITYIVILIQLK